MSISNRVNIELRLIDRMGPGLRKAAAKINQFAVRAREAGQAMAVGAAVMGAGIWKTVSIATELDDTMRSIAGRIGLNSENMAEMQRVIEDIGRTSSFTTAQVADLANKLAQGGQKADSIKQLLRPMLDLARATGVTGEAAAEFAQQALASFGLEAADAAHVADVLTFAANNSFQGVEDLGEALTYAGGVAKQTGQSFEVTVAGMAAMAKMGIKGSRAGRQLSQVLINLTKKAGETADELGFDLEDENGIRALPLILADFMTATKDLSALDRLEKFNDSFGKIGLNASLIGGQSAKEIMKMAKEMENLNGTASKLSKDMDGGIGGSMRFLWASIEGVGLALGQSMMPMLDALASYLTIVLNEIQPVIKAFAWLGPTIISTFLALAGGAAFLVGLGGTLTVISFVVGAVGSAISALAAIWGVLSSVVIATAGFLVSPWGLLLIAIAAVSVALIDFKALFGTITKWASGLWGDLSKTMGSTFTGVLAAMKGGSMELAFEIMLKGMAISFHQVMDSMFSGWRTFLVGVTDAVVYAAQTINGVWRGLIDEISNAIVFVQWATGQISTEDANAMSGMITADGERATKAQNDALRQTGEAFKKFFSSSSKDLQDELDELKRKADRLGKSWFDVREIYEGMTDAMGKAGSVVSPYIDEIKAIEAGIRGAVGSAGKAVMSFNQTASVVKGTAGAFSTAGLKSKLAKDANNLQKEQLAETVTSNTLLTGIKDAVTTGKLGFWGT